MLTLFKVITVPCGITAKTSDSERAALLAKCEAVAASLVVAGIRAEADLRDHVSPGWKFNHWELKGVPLRLELGPRDVAKGEVVLVRRNDGAKKVVKAKDIVESVQTELLAIHESMFTK